MTNDTNPEAWDDLPLENEILKLKLQAERGALFGGNGDLPPEVEHQFLQNIMAFEQQSEAKQTTTVFETLGCPEVAPVATLTDAQLPAALEQLELMMLEKGVFLNCLGQYPHREIYRFITEELFTQPIVRHQVPGLLTGFVYEQFHPNHRLTIEAHIQGFLEQFLNRQLEEDCPELNLWVLQKDHTLIDKAEIITRLTRYFDSYTAFDNGRFKITDIGFELNEDAQTGMGHAHGLITYDALGKDGSRTHIADSFSCYFTYDAGWWLLVYFEIPGFIWEE